MLEITLQKINSSKHFVFLRKIPIEKTFGHRTLRNIFRRFTWTKKNVIFLGILTQIKKLMSLDKKNNITYFLYHYEFMNLFGNTGGNTGSSGSQMNAAQQIFQNQVQQMQQQVIQLLYLGHKN